MLPSLASSKQKRKASGSTYPSAPILALMALTREKSPPKPFLLYELNKVFGQPMRCA